jgi:hypothetical protein
MRLLCILALWVLPMLTSNSFGEPATAVSLRAKVLSRRYCEVDENFGSLLVKFGVNISNEGQEAIKINPPFYPILLVARSVEDLRNGDLEFKLHGPDVFFPNRDQHPAPPTLVVLQHGQSHESETVETTVPTLRTSKFNKHAGVRPGIHYVQLVVYGDIKDSSATFRAISQPIEIRVEKNPYKVKCE